MARQMSVKEYIGARYIPVFYDDGEGGANWDINDKYEPLTIVTYNGNSYTSRQYVPEGTQITNTRYWLQTGNWNSQIEAYRQEVLQFSDDIDAAQAAANAAQTAADAAQSTANSADAKADQAGDDIDAIEIQIRNLVRDCSDLKKYEDGVLLGFGDSILYGRGCDTPATESPLAVMGQFLSMTTRNYSVNHGAFTRTSESGYRIRDQINQAITDGNNNVFNNYEVRLVILEGGVNDATDNAATSDVVAAVQSCIDGIRTAWPNAKILVLPVLQGIMGFSFYDTNRGSVYLSICEACRSKAVDYAKWGFAWGIGRMSWAWDQLHPNVAGSAGYAYAALLKLTGSEYQYNIRRYSFTTGAVEPVAAGSFFEYTMNGFCYLGGTLRITSELAGNASILRLDAAFVNQQAGSLPIVAYKHGAQGGWSLAPLTIKTELTDFANNTSNVLLRTTETLEEGATLWIPPTVYMMGA